MCSVVTEGSGAGSGAAAGHTNELVDLLSIETNDAQHDAVLDYYGRQLATCSSDKTIKIFEVEGQEQRLVETLKGYVVLPQFRPLERNII